MFNMINLIYPFSLIILILAVLLCEGVKLCPKPGEPRSTRILNKLANVYKNGDIIEYECAEALKGYLERSCVYGEWDLPMPLCSK